MQGSSKTEINNEDDYTTSPGRKSIYSMGNRTDKQSDAISFRVDFAKSIIAESKLDPMIYTEGLDTEAFIKPDGSDDLNDNGSRDTRKVLKKKLKNFHKIIERIGGQLKYVKSGTTGHTFKGIINNDGSNVEYAVKVVAYPKKEKYGDMYDAARPENAELMMIRLLSYFVVKKETPHVVLPIVTFDTSIKPFVDLIEQKVVSSSNKKYVEFVEKYKKGEYYDHVSILISEWANRGDFLEFIRRCYKNFELLHWKVFFFQIISVLAVIQSKYPAFRHNDLKANNILVQKIGRMNTSFVYTINKKKYYIPNIGYRIKIWDFDFACIDGVIDNAKVNAEWTTHINITPGKNRYYDLHYFFNTIIKKGFFPQFMEDDVVPQEARDFVERIVPKKYQSGKYVAKRGRILLDSEYTTPDRVLRTDEFFDEFRTNKNKN